MYESYNTILAALAIVAFVPFSYQKRNGRTKETNAPNP